MTHRRPAAERADGVAPRRGAAIAVAAIFPIAASGGIPGSRRRLCHRHPVPVLPLRAAGSVDDTPASASTRALTAARTLPVLPPFRWTAVIAISQFRMRNVVRQSTNCRKAIWVQWQAMARGRIPDMTSQDLQSTPIEEIVAEYVQPSPVARIRFRGCRRSRTSESPLTRLNHGYHGFATGKGGDVFSFLMEMEHLTFLEAEACAEKIGYRDHHEGGGTGRREEPARQRLIAANRRQKFTPAAGV